MKRILYFLLTFIMAANIYEVRAWEYPETLPDLLPGSGTEEDPYRVSNAQELANMAYYVNERFDSYEGKYIVLTNDIVLNENLIASNGYPVSGAKQWKPIGYPVSVTANNEFKGTFDGQGHTIRGMYIDDDDIPYAVGLFGFTSAATIKNLKVADSFVRGNNQYLGGIVGYGKWTHIQQNCSFYGTIVNRQNDAVGAIMAYGYNTCTIDNCYFEGMIDWEPGSLGPKSVGGVLGEGTSTTVTNCVVNADVKIRTATDGQCEYMGGVAGYCYNIENCMTTLKNDGSKNYVSGGTAKYVGGVAGIVDGYVKKCFNYATVAISHASVLGGVVGICYNEVSCSGNFGYLDLSAVGEPYYSNGFSAGGVAGASYGINGSFNAGNLYALNGHHPVAKIGGVMGAFTYGASPYMTNCFNTGGIQSSSDASYHFGLFGVADRYSYIENHNNYYLNGSATYSTKEQQTKEGKDTTFFQSYTNDGIIAYMEAIWGSGTWGLDPVKKLPIPIECGGVDAFFVMNDKGAGTVEDPYLITNYDELTMLHSRLSKGVNYKGIHFKQTCDLDFAENAFQPLGSLYEPSYEGWTAFLGHYDGDNHAVKNINYSNALWFPVGFFSELGEGAEVKNLRFTENSLTVSAAGKVGMVAGKATNASLSGIYVRDCQVSQTLPVVETIGSQIGYDNGAGALAGIFTGSISRSSVYYTDITGNQVGGLAGLMQGSSTVEDAVVQASLHASQYNVGSNSNYPQCAGGITSRASDVKVARCVVLPTVDYATYDSWGYMGGLFGYSNSGNSAEYTMCDMRQPASSISTWGLLMGSNGGATSLATTAVQIYDKSRYKGNGDALTNTEGIKDVVNDLHGWSPIYLNGDASNLGNMHFSYRYAVPYQGIGSYAVTSANGEYSDTPSMADYSEGFWTRPEHLYIDLSHPEVAWDNNVLTAVGDIDPLIVERKGNVVSSEGKASTIYLYDAKPVTYPASITTDKLNYSRNFANTSWQPLYVPFSMTCDKWTSAGLELASISALSETQDESGNPVMVLEVKKVTEGSIEANTPYLVRAKETGEKLLDLRNVTLAATETTAKVLGTDLLTCTITPTYAGINTFNSDGDDATTDYLMKGGTFGKASATAVLNPQRWYITLSSNKSNMASLANRIIILENGAGSATRIEDIRIEAGNIVANQPMYDLQGRRLSSALQKGIYIIKNKKIIK